MGWLIGWNSRQALVDHLLKRSENERVKQEPIAKFFSGNHLWTVWETTTRADALTQLGAQALDNPPVDAGAVKKRFIVLFLLQCWPVKGGSQGEREWGYKDIEESCGPVETTCPLSFLEMAPPIEGDTENEHHPANWSKCWRERVRAYWKQRAERQKQRRARRTGSVWAVRA